LTAGLYFYEWRKAQQGAWCEDWQSKHNNVRASSCRGHKAGASKHRKEFSVFKSVIVPILTYGYELG